MYLKECINKINIGSDFELDKWMSFLPRHGYKDFTIKGGIWNLDKDRLSVVLEEHVAMVFYNKKGFPEENFENKKVSFKKSTQAKAS